MRTRDFTQLTKHKLAARQQIWESDTTNDFRALNKAFARLLDNPRQALLHAKCSQDAYRRLAGWLIVGILFLGRQA